jgi:molybdate transport system regulatory protein
MVSNKKLKLSFKFWIEYKGKPALGEGGARILESIDREHSISKTAEKLNMSYRYIWNYLNRIEKVMEEPVVEKHRGGKTGGGSTTLNETGRNLLAEYKRLKEKLLTDTRKE